MAAQIRKKKSTISSIVSTFQSANALPKPTEPLNEREKAYFDRIMKSREMSTWADHDLSMATMLAMSQIQYLDAMAAMKEVGRTMLNERGTPVVNPEAGVLNQLAGSIRSLTTILGLSASQKGAHNQSQIGRNKSEQEARKVIERASADDLLA